MDIALLTVRLCLALVFFLAGVSKLGDLPGSRQAMREFGVPAPLVPLTGLALPLVEIAIAVALVPTQSAWVASLAAFVLLGCFIATIAFNLSRGRRPDCHCFGQIYSQPIGIGTLARNGLLLVAAAFIAWQGRSGAGLSATGWILDLSPLQGATLGLIVIGIVLLAALWWLLLHLIRMNGRLLLRLEALEGNGPGMAAMANSATQPYGLPVGAPAPEFALPSLDGETVTLATLRSPGKPVLLVFVSPSCGSCSQLMPDLARMEAERRDLTVVLLSTGHADENRAKRGHYSTPNILLQAANEVADAYGSPGTPSAVIVAPDGTVDSPMVAGVDAVRSLAMMVSGRPAA